MILSIQSDVLHGVVGQQAAQPFYQGAGFQLGTIDTVTMAAHPGFGTTHRLIMPPEDMAALLAECDRLLPTGTLTALHIGYLGSAEQIDVIAPFIKAQRAAHPQLSVLIDPVFGDGGRTYVADDIIQHMTKTLLPLATLLTPNHFEASYLAGRPLTDEEDIEQLYRQLGVPSLCVTGLTDDEHMMVTDCMFTPSGVVSVSHRAQPHGISGAGDAFAAMLHCFLLRGASADVALHQTSHLVNQMVTDSKSPSTLEMANGLGSFQNVIGSDLSDLIRRG